MKLRIQLVAAAGLAALAAGCGSDKCPTESPQVNAMAAGCTAVAGQPVTYPVRLCPACNLSNVSCDVQISGNQIFLNPTAEACSNPSSCSTSCALQPAGCTFTAPGPGTYTVSVYDPATASTLSETLTVQSGGSPSCALASAPGAPG